MIIAIEGIDGSGKSTIIERIKHQVSYPIVWTAEPYRRRPQSEDLLPMQRLFAFMEDHDQHIEEVVMPALKAGRDVVTDRYITSRIVYQGLELADSCPVHGISWTKEGFTKYIRQLHQCSVWPDYEIFINVSPAAAVIRCSEKGESLSLQRAKDLREMYLRQYSRLHNVSIIDGNRPIEQVAKDVLNEIEGSLCRGR
jgi:dTMP kinase